MFKNTKFTTLNSQIQEMINTTTTLANASIESVKQIAFVQCDTVRTFTQESANFTKNLCQVTTPAQFTALIQEFMTATINNCVAKSQELASVLNTSKATFSSTASSTIKGAQESLVKSVDKFSTVNPTFSKVASESLQSWISTSNQAADSASKVSAQVAETAAKNIAAATTATIDTVKKAATATTAN